MCDIFYYLSFDFCIIYFISSLFISFHFLIYIFFCAKVGITLLMHVVRFCDFTNYYSSLVAKSLLCVYVLKHDSAWLVIMYIGSVQTKPDQRIKEREVECTKWAGMRAPAFSITLGSLLIYSYSYWWVANDRFSMKFTSKNSEITLYRYVLFKIKIKHVTQW